MPFFADILATLSGTHWFFLFLALALALGFEFVNGFHDTANAVATVIYTHTLRPGFAVIWSGLFNLLGVLTSSGAVAYGIVALLPVELVLNVGSASGFAMVFSLLISAIVWNAGTWYLGLPASSSHSLIGAILGVGLANGVIAGHPFGEGVNWPKAGEVGLSLLISPAVGFICSAGLLLLLRLLIRDPKLFSTPPKDQPPPPWIRSLLVLTCTGVSFSHGSNDGQKGMGLIVLILVGLLPAQYALNLAAGPEHVRGIAAHATALGSALAKPGAGAEDPKAGEKELSAFVKPQGKPTGTTLAAVGQLSQSLAGHLQGVQSFSELSEGDRRIVRNEAYLVGTAIGKLDKAGRLAAVEDKKALLDLKKELDAVTKYIPTWVKVAVALSLGLGTTIGWKRIVVTVGEKIGKSHLTYGQGASAEFVAMITIFAADQLGLPVSTTHVLSSGVAGTMAANGSGLQAATLRNILLAWVLTLPVCVFLGSVLFAFSNYLVLYVFGLH